MIAVVDYHKGNLRSVERGLIGVGGDARITDDPRTVASAQAIVLPGVGAFSDAMDSLDNLGLSAVLRERVAAGVPFMGICLGLHLLYAGGLEHAVDGAARAGLGLLEGVVDALPKVDAQGNSYKIPHVGWNSVDFLAENDELFAGIADGEFFYFTHSFVAPDSPATIATTTHSVTFASAVRLPGLPAWGVQFHPEKSSDAGAHVLSNFVKACEQA